MGLLALGTPLEWKDAKQHADHVREHGIVQFLHIWERLKDRTGDVMLWGDEVSSSCHGRGLGWVGSGRTVVGCRVACVLRPNHIHPANPSPPSPGTPQRVKEKRAPI